MKKKFYFTFGTNPKYPFCNGHVVVHADSQKEAVNIFRKYHPDNNGCINCAFIYEEDAWEKIKGKEQMEMNICHAEYGKEEEMNLLTKLNLMNSCEDFKIITGQDVADIQERCANMNDLTREQIMILKERGLSYESEQYKCHFIKSKYCSEDVIEEMQIYEAITSLAIKDGADLVQFPNGNIGFVAYYNGHRNGFEILEEPKPEQKKERRNMDNKTKKTIVTKWVKSGKDGEPLYTELIGQCIDGKWKFTFRGYNPIPVKGWFDSSITKLIDFLIENGFSRMEGKTVIYDTGKTRFVKESYPVYDELIDFEDRRVLVEH